MPEVHQAPTSFTSRIFANPHPANMMKHADYRSFASDDLHMDYASPEDEEALLPDVKATAPRLRSLNRTLITGVLVVVTIVCSGFLVSLNHGSATKLSSTNSESMFQSVTDGNYINLYKLSLILIPLQHSLF